MRLNPGAAGDKPLPGGYRALPIMHLNPRAAGNMLQICGSHEKSKLATEIESDLAESIHS